MKKHVFPVIVITLLLGVAMFLPFMPGDYDAFTISLSGMVQLFSFAGLLLVIVGMAWLIYEIQKRSKNQLITSKGRYRFGMVALIIGSLVILISSLGAFANQHLSFAIIMLLVWGWVLVKLTGNLKQVKHTNDAGFHPAPLYLICIPAFLLLTRMLFIVPATEYSRNYAIRQADQLIQDIEMYHRTNGHYPVSLLSLWEDYKPGIMGIQRYYYEPQGNAYNLCFEQFSHRVGVREIVMYNKLDQQEMTSHNSDLLQIVPQNIRRGYLFVFQIPGTHWKYFWFD